MLRHRHIDKICIGAAAAAFIIMIVLMLWGRAFRHREDFSVPCICIEAV